MRLTRTNEATPFRPAEVLHTSNADLAGHDTSRGRSSAEVSSSNIGSSPFTHFLRDLGRELDRGEDMAQKAIRSREGGASPERLIALQAGIYRYSEAVDLAAKLVDKGSQAVRTTLQNQ